MTLSGLKPHEPWWTRDAATIVDELATDASLGLSSSEASERFTVLGPNELDEEPTRPPWLLFAGQFANTMIVVLLIAAAITVAIGDLKDAAVIVAIVILNAAIGFFQEYRAEQAMAALRNMAAPLARVAIVLTASTGVFWAVELEKAIHRKRERNKPAPPEQKPAT